jgi:hypothetical protein
MIAWDTCIDSWYPSFPATGCGGISDRETNYIEWTLYRY